jgi:hypothetical protein
MDNLAHLANASRIPSAVGVIPSPTEQYPVSLG